MAEKLNLLTVHEKATLITLGLFSFNQEKYIRAAVESALAQDYSPLEIIILDDCSQDKSFEIIKEIINNYTGLHKIILKQNIKNLGIGAQVNLLMQYSSGSVIVAAAGDDISLPNRVTRLNQKFNEVGFSAYSIWSSAKYIDKNDNVLKGKIQAYGKHNDKSMVKNINPVIGATHAWRREVFDFFGPLLPGIVFEDNAISFRSYLLGGVEFIDEVLVEYRRHDSNLTNYSRNSSLKKTYARAYLRVVAKHIGLMQRISDLEKIFGSKKNISYISKQLKLEVRKNMVLIDVYKNFPNFKIKHLPFIFIRLEVLKVYIRSFSYKLFGDGFVL